MLTRYDFSMKAIPSLPAGFPNMRDAIDRPWLPYVARAGYASRGVVYLLVGGLAILSALGQRGGESADQKDALGALLNAPAGVVLLGALALGLLCFAVWRTIQAVLNVDGHEHNAKGFFARAGLFVSALTHLALAIAAARIAWGSGGGGEEQSRSWTAWLMSQPAGPWLVAGVGVAMLITGIAHGVKAVKRKWEQKFDLDAATLERLRPMFMFGLIARGFVFVVIAVFFLYAAWTYDPSQAGGLADVFNTVRRQPFGATLLGLLAAGLFAFGMYGLAQARYRRVHA
jgi:hypothetical protein